MKKKKEKCWKSLSTEFFAVLLLSVRRIVRPWRASLVHSLRSQAPALHGSWGTWPQHIWPLFHCIIQCRSAPPFVPRYHPSYITGCSGILDLGYIFFLHFLRTNPTFQLLESLWPHLQSLFKSPDQVAWNHVSWLFPGLQWLEWFSGRPCGSVCVAGFDHQPHQENEFYHSACVL